MAKGFDECSVSPCSYPAALMPPRVRVMVKVPGCDPSQLVPGWQWAVRRVLESACCATLRQLHVRRGCTQIIAEMELDDAAAMAQPGAAAAEVQARLQMLADAVTTRREFLTGGPQPRLVASGQAPTGSLCDPVLLQLEQVAMLLQPDSGEDSGPLSTLLPAATSEALGAGVRPRWAVPPGVVAVVPAAVPMTRQLASEPGDACSPRSALLTIFLDAPLPEDCALHMRIPGSSLMAPVVFTSDPRCIQVQFPVPAGFFGLVDVEVMDRATGLMGLSAHFVVTTSAEVAQELCSVQQQRPAGPSSAGGGAAMLGNHPFLLDYGRWTGDALWRQHRRRHRRRGARPLGASVGDQDDACMAGVNLEAAAAAAEAEGLDPEQVNIDL